MSTTSSGVVSDDFPAGLRVLVVDDDPTCLVIIERMLRSCKYEVTKCKQAAVALSLLRENKNGYDIVLSDVHMPDMDGFKLLEHIGLEMDLPVIMMSADDSKKVVMKGVTHGACDYLIKPVRIEALKTIWQHVFRKRKNDFKDAEQQGSVEDGDRNQKPSDEADYSSSANEGNWKNAKKRNNEEDENEERDDSSTLKKPRVVWSVDLHQQFVAAVNQLGIDKAVPKKILELMNVPGLTRENVASHLQKYRLYLRRLSGVSQHQSNVNNSFLSPQGTAFGPLSTLNGIDLQALAATGQFAALQAAARPTAKTGMPIPLTDQRNIFSFENPKLSFLDGHQLNSAKQVNLLHGIPTTMEPKPLGQGGQGSSMLMQMAHSQSGVQMLSDMNNGNIPQNPTSLSQPIGSNGGVGGSLIRNGIDNQGRSGYNTLPPSSSVLKFPVGHTTDLPINSFPLGSMPEISTVAPKDTFQGEMTSGIKNYGGFMRASDPFRDLHNNRTNEWRLQNAGLSFNASQSQNSFRGSVDPSQMDLLHGRFSSGQSSLQNMDASAIGKSMLSGEGIERGNTQVVQNFNTFSDNSVQVKTEAASDTSYQTTFGPESFGQEDLMSAFLKQQQGGGVQAENEFDFSGYTMDNIPV